MYSCNVISKICIATQKVYTLHYNVHMYNIRRYYMYYITKWTYMHIMYIHIQW